MKLIFVDGKYFINIVYSDGRACSLPIMNRKLITYRNKVFVTFSDTYVDGLAVPVLDGKEFIFDGKKFYLTPEEVSEYNSLSSSLQDRRLQIFAQPRARMNFA